MSYPLITSEYDFIIRGNLLSDLITSINLNLQKRYETKTDDPLDALVLRRSLKLLYGILKEFSNIKMPNGVKIMAKARSTLNIRALS